MVYLCNPNLKITSTWIIFPYQSLRRMATFPMEFPFHLVRFLCSEAAKEQNTQPEPVPTSAQGTGWLRSSSPKLRNADGTSGPLGQGRALLVVQQVLGLDSTLFHSLATAVPSRPASLATAVPSRPAEWRVVAGHWET